MDLNIDETYNRTCLPFLPKFLYIILHLMQEKVGKRDKVPISLSDLKWEKFSDINFEIDLLA